MSSWLRLFCALRPGLGMCKVEADDAVLTHAPWPNSCPTCWQGTWRSEARNAALRGEANVENAGCQVTLKWHHKGTRNSRECDDFA
jgi:hypothetical protein